MVSQIKLHISFGPAAGAQKGALPVPAIDDAVNVYTVAPAICAAKVQIL